jgi:aspartyl-tRNA(Asn)/glutamyl-tRNA(Gln) amidotransferase subunit A
MTALHHRSIAELSAAYDDRSLSPVELVTAVLDRIAAIDDRYLAYLAVLREAALDDARAAEAELARGRRRGPLHGIPVGLKDLVDMAGVETSGGSRAYRGRIAEADAEVVRQLRAGGAVILGKHNLYELGTGLPMPGDWPVPARNPWDTDRIPGGSSSGSAVAVAMGMASGGYGTDTGGSIRGPASYCGIVGMKPTYDAISRDGVMALSWTLDHVGPMARTVDDVAALLAGATGTDVRLGTSVEAVRVGVPRALVDATEMEDGIRGAFEAALGVLGDAGTTIVPVELPDLALTEAVLLTIIGCEGLAAHGAVLGEHPDRFGPSARERISAGLAYAGVDYVNALRARDEVVARMAALYREVDVVVSPVVTQVAPTRADFELRPPHRTPFTGIHNLVGAPAVSVPAGFDRQGMPIGVQVAGPHGADARVLTVARAYEQRAPWHLQRPPEPPSTAGDQA